MFTYAISLIDIYIYINTLVVINWDSAGMLLK